MPRWTSDKEFEDASAEVIFGFAKALRAQREYDVKEEAGRRITAKDERRLQDVVEAAYVTARKWGWDYEEDETWQQYAYAGAKATGQELIIFGLQRSLEFMHAEA